MKKKTENPYRAARQMFVNEEAYWRGRRDRGDLFLDDWMWDAWMKAKEGIAILDWYEEHGYDTCKRELHKPLRAAKEE